MTVNAITDTKKGEQGLRLLIFILPLYSNLDMLLFIKVQISCGQISVCVGERAL